MSKFAWVTLTTNDTYSLGALVLAHSLKRVGTVHQLAVLVTPTVSEAMRSRLQEVYNVVQEVNVLDSHDAANLALLSRPELGVTFTKLHAWRLTQFEKCVFLDSDILVLQNADELFEREELSAAPDVSWPDCFNSGVFVYRPNEDTFASLIDFAMKNGSFDGGDQGLLNLFFSDWATKDISKHLPFTYNTAAFASYSYLPAFKQFKDKIKILHFAGKFKPWLSNFNSETKQAHIPSEFQHAADLVQLWWTIFCDNVHQNLSDQMQSYWQKMEFQTIPTWTDNIHYTNDTTSYNLSNYDSGNFFDDYQPFQDPWEDYYENLEKLKNSSNNNATTATITPSTENSPTSQIDLNSNFVPSVPSEPSEPSEPSVPSVPSATTDESNLHHQTHQQNQNVSQSEDFHNDNKPEQITTNFTENLAQIHDNLNNNTNPSNDRVSSPETMNESEQVLNATELDKNNEPDNSTKKDTSNLDSNSIMKSKNQDTLIVEKTHSDKKLSASEAGLAGALSHIRLGEPRSSEQEAYEASMRRQCWEAGNIDYSGRDSFDNIWKKISQTLDSKPASSKPADGSN